MRRFKFQMEISIRLISFLILCNFLKTVKAVHCTLPKCEFNLDIRYGTTMSVLNPSGTERFNVVMDGDKLKVVKNDFHREDPEIGQYVDPHSVWTADGFSRNIITINGEFPGPTLEVMHNCEVRYI